MWSLRFWVCRSVLQGHKTGEKIGPFVVLLRGHFRIPGSKYGFMPRICHLDKITWILHKILIWKKNHEKNSEKIVKKYLLNKNSAKRFWLKIKKKKKKKNIVIIFSNFFCSKKFRLQSCSSTNIFHDFFKIRHFKLCSKTAKLLWGNPTKKREEGMKIENTRTIRHILTLLAAALWYGWFW